MKKRPLILLSLAVLLLAPALHGAERACLRTVYTAGNALDDGTGSYATLKDGGASFIAGGARFAVGPASAVKVLSCGPSGIIAELTGGRVWIESGKEKVTIKAGGGVLKLINGTAEVSMTGAYIYEGRGVYSKGKKNSAAGAGSYIIFRAGKASKQAAPGGQWQEDNRRLGGVTVLLEKDFDSAFDTVVAPAVKGVFAGRYCITGLYTYMDARKEGTDLNLKIKLTGGGGELSCKAILSNAIAGDVVSIIERKTAVGGNITQAQAARKVVTDAASEASEMAREYVARLLCEGTKVVVEAEGLKPAEFDNLAKFLPDLKGVTGFSSTDYYGQKKVYIFNYAGCGDDIAAILKDKKSYINIWKYSKNIVKLSNRQ